jgi:F0F1-type ATP synthase membrane subunit b/b'
MNEERAALVATKDRAVADAKAQANVELDQLKREKAEEIERTKAQFQSQIHQLQQ